MSYLWVAFLSSMVQAVGETPPEQAGPPMVVQKPAAADSPGEKQPSAEAKPEAKPAATGAKPAEEKKDPFDWLKQIKVKGWVTFVITPYPWLTPTFPDANRNTFRIRFARVVADWTPIADVQVRLHFAGEQATAGVFFDYFITWKRFGWLNVTLGQQKPNLGAAIAASGFDLKLPDRAKFIVQMTKQNFRDIGLAVHTTRGENRTFEYMVGLFNGSGRIPFTQSTANRAGNDYWLMARAVLNLGPALFGKDKRMALGLTGSTESARGTMDANAARVNLGGTTVPFTKDRTTYTGGADIHIDGIAGLYLMAEFLFLYSTFDEGQYQRQLGFYIEPGYTLPVLDKMVQIIGRFEWWRMDLSKPTYEYAWTLGLNVTPLKNLLVGAYFVRDVIVGGSTGGNRLEARVQLHY